MRLNSIPISSAALLAVLAAALLVKSAAAAPRRLLAPLEGAATPDQQVAAMAQFRSAEVVLLKKVSAGTPGARETYLVVLRGIIGCSGPEPDQLADVSAQALASTTPQYPEYEPYQGLRNSLIEEALASIKASPPNAQQCSDSFNVSRQLGIPDAALAVYG